MTDNEDKSSDNIFKIMDNVISQLNTTKKMFIIMILTVMVLPPLTFAISHSILESQFEHREEHGPPSLLSLRHIPLFISLAWLGVGIRQWLVLSGWTKKY
ncbi:MAG TPA: hypothetical protein HA292_01720, partial [Candidatus Nitrosotenuis sp.]|nr:hypothetical protein [Candidatus Nitrosotenuis sp.]